MLLVNIVSDAQNLLIGIQLLRNVLLVILMNLGIQTPTLAIAVLLQDLFREENAFVLLLKHNGMLSIKFVTALQILLVPIVKHVQLQDSGIQTKTNVFAHHQRTYGIPHHNNVNVQVEDTEKIVFNAQHQDTGIKN